jgi:chromosome segregation ATPase
MIKYSKKTDSCYDTKLNYKSLPADVIDITDEDHQEFMGNGKAQGKERVKGVYPFQFKAIAETSKDMTQEGFSKQFEAATEVDTDKYDDSELQLRVNELSDKIESEKYDDSELQLKVKELSGKIESLSSEMHKISSEMHRMLSEICKIKHNKDKGDAIINLKLDSMQKEINSNRKESGYKIDVVEQKLNKIKGVKKWRA